MSNKSGGSGCGWFLGLLAMLAAVLSLGESGRIAGELLKTGLDGSCTETGDGALFFLVIAVVCLLLAKRKD